MEKSFNNRTSVIYQNPHHPKNYKMVKQRWLLVPMCEYKVSVPYPKEEALNLFQMTILKLLVSGNKSNDHIASCLCLNIELVEFIIEELKRFKLIDDRRRLTEAGYKIVKDESNSYDIRIGYVYYNYVTKTYMDAFVPDDKHTELETGRRNNEMVSFDLGTVSNRDWKRGLIINVDTSATVSPNPYEVLAICKKHNRRTRNLGFMDEETEGISSIVEKNTTKTDTLDLPWEIQSVKMLGTQRDVYVATYMFMAADDVINRSKLQVCYPFGEGTSSSLVESIDRLSHVSNNSALKNEILGLKNDVFGMTDADIEKVKKGHSEAEKKIKMVLSAKIDDYPAVRDALLNVESSYLLVKGLIETNKGSNREIIKKNLDDYIKYNYNLLSSILIDTAREYDYFTDAALTNYVQQNSMVLSTMAKKIGFEDPYETTFERFFKLKKRAIKEAIHESQRQLNALFAYNLIIAEHFPGHPFYELSRTIPNLIIYLSALRDLRNNSVHPNEIYHDFELVSSYRKKNMYIAYLLLKGLSFNNDDKEDEESKKDKEMLVKVMRDAEITCESVYENCFQKNTYIANQLRNLQLEILLEGDDYPNRCSEVFEAMFRTILTRRRSLDAMAIVKDSTKQEMRNDLLSEMRGYGYIVDIPPYYYKDRVLATIRDCSRGTLLNLFYAWYYSERKRDDDMLQRMASLCPEFIKLMDEIHSNRGHSGKMDFKDTKLDFTKRHIDSAINSLLIVMSENSVL